MNPPSPPLEAAAAPILCTVDVVLLTLNPQLQVALLPRGTGLACDYAGRIPTAKGFGSLPLYALRRSGFEEEMA